MAKMTPSIELTVPSESAGARLDAFLGADARIGTRSRAGRLIKQGLVSVDGRAPRKSLLLSGGETVVCEISTTDAVVDPSSPAVPFSVDFEDDYLLVVDKPAGLVVHPAPGNLTGTLSQALAGRAGGGDPSRPGIVHRLDKETSGLLVVAKDDHTLRSLQVALQERHVRREYLALVRGRPQSRSGTIDAPLGRDRRSPDLVAVRSDSPRAAVTHFEVIEELPQHTLLRVRLETGRTHQIRAHLAAIDLPVSGDRTYGVSDDLGLKRQFLHAAGLAFTHPATDDSLAFESPLPAELESALAQARRADDGS